MAAGVLVLKIFISPHDGSSKKYRNLTIKTKYCGYTHEIDKWHSADKIERSTVNLCMHYITNIAKEYLDW